MNTYIYNHLNAFIRVKGHFVILSGYYNLQLEKTRFWKFLLFLRFQTTAFHYKSIIDNNKQNNSQI